MAGTLRKEFGVDVEVVPGSTGELTVWAGGRMVAKKGFLLFPKDRNVVRAIAGALKP